MGNCMCKYACSRDSTEPRMLACCAKIAEQLSEAPNLRSLILINNEKEQQLEVASKGSYLESSDGDDGRSSFHSQLSTRTGGQVLQIGLPPDTSHYIHSCSNRDKVDGLPEADLFTLEGLSNNFEFPTSWPLCPCQQKHVLLSSKQQLRDCFDIAAILNGSDKHTMERLKVSISRTHLRVYAVTWNMNGKKSALQDLIKLASSLDNEQYDLFVVGLQEVPSCDAESLLLGAFGEGHSIVATATMMSLQLFIICRRVLQPHFEDVKVDKVGGGGFGAVVRRQKGAVAVSLKFKEAAFLFIASHLSPHESNVEERNSQFQRISQTLFSSRSPSPRLSSCLNASPVEDFTPSSSGSETPFAFPGGLTPATASPPSTTSSAVEDSDLVVWLGDLNYRIQDHRSLVYALINQNLYKPLWHKDQLSREIERGHVFKGFREGPLSFRPTYKYDVGTDNYDTSPKERVPSWTDRILYKVKGGSIKVNVCDYDAIDSIKSSDHRPVKAVFTLSPR
ncbi:hypothetical protein GOP47_0002739 [Adiantum capillus-veneris]|uniref:Inositol polyphosphate-related phosphatase domain-containing protein n=1 Tax=Adiantum capillus-veneris TaxID=13818 RepID=A0A9D4VAM8_ADICA|nr:hypothetical protein GOP47_0002739 [Adiantum capillus-veneris]